MAELIYSYINEFPIIESKFSEKKDDTNGPNNADCGAFKGTILESLENNDDSFSTKCKIIAKYQGDIINDANSTKPALCNYINYWFYNTLKKDKQSNHYTLLGQFYEKITSLKFCNKYNREITPEIYKDLKLIYELYEDFNKFKDESLVATKDTCENGKKCIQRYKENVKNCHYNYKNGLCMNLINFKYKYDEHIAKMTGCKKDIENLETIKTDLEAIILLPFVTMTLISFILIFLYKFTSFGSWIRPKLGVKNRANKLDKRMQRLQNTSENGGRKYKLPYHTSYS